MSEDHETAPGTFSSLENEQGVEAFPGERKVSTQKAGGKAEEKELNYKSSKTSNMAAAEREKLVILIHKGNKPLKRLLRRPILRLKNTET